MTNFNPNKKLQIEIHSNDLSGSNGYTVFHIVGKDNRRVITRKADDKDFEWMNDQQMRRFNNGTYKFKITAQMAIDTFGYLY